MPTDEQSTQGADATAHQPLQDSQNAQAHSDQSFDARRAFDATNRRVNDLNDKLKDFDPALLVKIAEKVGIVESKPEVVDTKTPDVSEVVKQELWRDKNASRISQVGDKFQEYLKLGYREEHALRLAEQDNGIKVDTSEQKRQQTVSTASSGVDRDLTPDMPDSLKGLMTPEQFAKIAPKASKVQVIR